MSATPMGFDAKSLVASLPERPGVYRMLDAEGQVLYVGKAKSLKKRVSSYFRERHPSPRIALMVRQIASVEVTVTASEDEALLLENTLIKRLEPRYNILFRDDKSYPYVLITREETPRLGFFRGTPDRQGDYFGPYPSAGSVRRNLQLLQKIFRLRSCEDAVFANRSRPCLLYQIRRCSAPCTGLIDADAYREDVRIARLFLRGQGQEAIRALTARMESAASALAFEQAARLRDQIQSLAQLRSRQHVTGLVDTDTDVLVAVAHEGAIGVNLAMIRAGEHLGDRPMFPVHGQQADAEEVLASFVRQHYLKHPAPARILFNLALPAEIEGDLRVVAGESVAVGVPRGDAQRAWVAQAEDNLRLALAARAGSQAVQVARLEALRDALSLDELPQRIECFDISHTQGERPVASCVVWREMAMCRREYRRFNIREITGGDDYAAIAQAVRRRYDGLAAEARVGEGDEARPDLVLIDGGIGQVRAAAAVLAELGLADLTLLGIAKGEGRKPGLEKLVPADGRQPIQLPPDHPGLQLLLQIRDEAHRFAVAGHRARRGRARRESALDEVSGVGPRRRKLLIAHFGSVQGVREASSEQIAQVPGIGPALAADIYRALH
jgi:excinuclease ABC subunit C